MSASPPPYYPNPDAAQAEQRDLGAEIKRLSEEIVRTAEDFYVVQFMLEGQGTVKIVTQETQDKWRALQESYNDLMWSARRSATLVESHNTDFVEVILPTIADPGEKKAAKIAELDIFCQKPPPQFLTSEGTSKSIEELKLNINQVRELYESSINRLIESAHEDIAKSEEELERERTLERGDSHNSLGSHFAFFKAIGGGVPQPPNQVDYASKAALARSLAETLQNQHETIKQKTGSIVMSLDNVPNEIARCMLTLWRQLNEDAKGLKLQMEGSVPGSMPDLTRVSNAYTSIKEALWYFSTNVNKLKGS